jgi:hypothetical protein
MSGRDERFPLTVSIPHPCPLLLTVVSQDERDGSQPHYEEKGEDVRQNHEETPLIGQCYYRGVSKGSQGGEMVPPGADHCGASARSAVGHSSAFVPQVEGFDGVVIVPATSVAVANAEILAAVRAPRVGRIRVVGRDVAASAAVGRTAQRTLIIRQCRNQLRLFQGNSMAIVAFLRAETVRVGGREGTEQAVGQHR